MVPDNNLQPVVSHSQQTIYSGNTQNVWRVQRRGRQARRIVLSLLVLLIIAGIYIWLQTDLVDRWLQAPLLQQILQIQ